MKRRVLPRQRWRFAGFLLLSVTTSQFLDGRLIECLTPRRLEYVNYECVRLLVQPVDLE